MVGMSGFREFTPEEVFKMLGPKFESFVLRNVVNFPKYTDYEKLMTVRAFARFYISGRLTLSDSGNPLESYSSVLPRLRSLAV
jgi:hypothetical protein